VKKEVVIKLEGNCFELKEAGYQRLVENGENTVKY